MNTSSASRHRASAGFADAFHDRGLVCPGNRNAVMHAAQTGSAHAREPRRWFLDPFFSAICLTLPMDVGIERGTIFT